jgi:hypothetical protein
MCIVIKLRLPLRRSGTKFFDAAYGELSTSLPCADGTAAI